MILNTAVVEGIRKWMDALAAHKPGFRRRREQDRAIMSIAATLQREGDATRVAAIEGPTGVGKSIAYLVAGLVTARIHGKKLVVSTATVALQQQLAEDLAHLAAIAPEPFKATVLKGRSRYVCDRNLAHLAGEDPDQLGLDLGGDPAGGQWPFVPSDAEREAVASLKAARSGKGWDGDLDGWAHSLPPKLRPLLTTSGKACAGQACPYASRCPLLRARRSVFDADVVVANHALLLADQRSAGGGALLPSLGDVIVVVDEAHHLPDVAVAAAAASAALGGHAKRIRESIEASRRMAAARGKSYGPSILDRLSSAELEVVSVLDKLSLLVTAKLGASTSQATRRYGRTFGKPAQARLSLQDLSPLMDDLASAAVEAGWIQKQLEREKEKLVKDPPVGVGTGALSRLSREVGDAGDYIESVALTLSLLSTEDDPRYAPTARWVSRDARGAVEVHASPVDASGWLASHLWRPAFGAVAVSATLRAMGEFRHFAERSGLSRVDDVTFAALPSPFDLEGQAVLRVPAMVSEPSSEDEYIAEVMMELEESLDPAEGTLILCASAVLMEAVVDRLPPSLRDRVKVQGSKSIGALLEDHRRDVAAGMGSVLVGLATLAEGVDLPGRQCSHVVIVKLPFMSPNDPVSETRSEWLTGQGRSPFVEILLPDAHRRLVQACGRLVRTETDAGRITVLDQRLLTKTYGRRMLETLPPYRRDIGQIADRPPPRPVQTRAYSGRSVPSRVTSKRARQVR